MILLVGSSAGAIAGLCLGLGLGFITYMLTQNGKTTVMVSLVPAALGLIAGFAHARNLSRAIEEKEIDSGAVFISPLRVLGCIAVGIGVWFWTKNWSLAAQLSGFILLILMIKSWAEHEKMKHVVLARELQLRRLNEEERETAAQARALLEPRKVLNVSAGTDDNFNFLLLEFRGAYGFLLVKEPGVELSLQSAGPYPVKLSDVCDQIVESDSLLIAIKNADLKNTEKIRFVKSCSGLLASKPSIPAEPAA